MHDVTACAKPDCFACKLASINFSPYATPGQLRPENKPKREADSWAKGVVRDGGGEPIRRLDGTAIGLKELTGNRSAVEREIRNRYEAGRAGKRPEGVS